MSRCHWGLNNGSAWSGCTWWIKEQVHALLRSHGQHLCAGRWEEEQTVVYQHKTKSPLCIFGCKKKKKTLSEHFEVWSAHEEAELAKSSNKQKLTARPHIPSCQLSTLYAPLFSFHPDAHSICLHLPRLNERKKECRVASMSTAITQGAKAENYDIVKRHRERKGC